MMKHFKLTSAIVLVAGFLPMSAAAQIPVTDGLNVAQSIAQVSALANNLAALNSQINQMTMQITLAQNQIEAMTGSYDFSQFANTDAFKELRQAIEWQDAFTSITDTSSTGPIQTAGRLAIEEYGLIEGADLFDSADGSAANPLVMAHNKSRDVIAASAGVARVTMEKAPTRVLVYEAFIDEIDSTVNAKASSDLSARIAAENGLLMNELIQLMSVTIELQQTMLARELASDQADRAFFKSDPVVSP